MTPEELLEMTPKDARDLCLIYQNEATTKKGKPLSDNAILARQTAVASFLDYNDKTITWKRRSRVNPRPDVTSHVFNNGDLFRMFQVGDIQEKCMLALATSLGWEISAFTNLSRETLNRLLERQQETKEEYVYFRQIRKKTGQPRLGILNPLAIEWSRKWLKFSENQKIQQNKMATSDIFNLTERAILRRIKKLANKAGIKTTGSIKFHSIRKWVMSGLSRCGFNEWQVKYVLGKAIPMSDGTYLQSLEQEVRERYPKAYEEYLNLETSIPRKAVTTITKDLDTKTSEIEELKAQVKELTERIEESYEVVNGQTTPEQQIRILEELLKRVKEGNPKPLRIITEKKKRASDTS